MPAGETETSVKLNLSASHVAERQADAAAMLRDLNAARARTGLAPVRMDSDLCAIARSHAVDMVTRRYFGHNTPEGATPFDRMDKFGFKYGWAGENLALDVDQPSAHKLLWRSNDHRENMLEPHFSRVGIVAVATERGEIFVEDFAD
ncbi:MAG: hypothetical protein GIW95_10495 [Candidatus Eremiobacteraeota bacterium]|nr:hypothetical protein [Candidatus Eremiobacteraeota bacterium]